MQLPCSKRTAHMRHTQYVLPCVVTGKPPHLQRSCQRRRGLRTAATAAAAASAIRRVWRGRHRRCAADWSCWGRRRGENPHAGADAHGREGRLECRQLRREVGADEPRSGALVAVQRRPQRRRRLWQLRGSGRRLRCRCTAWAGLLGAGCLRCAQGRRRFLQRQRLCCGSAVAVAALRALSARRALADCL